MCIPASPILSLPHVTHTYSIHNHPSGIYFTIWQHHTTNHITILLFSLSFHSKSNHILDFLVSNVFRVSLYATRIHENLSRIHLNTSHSTFNTYVFHLFWQYGVRKKFLIRKKSLLMVCLLIFFCIFDELFSYN